MATLFAKGQTWTRELEDALGTAFYNGSNLEQLCRQFGRTPAGIISRLVGLGMIVQIGERYYKVDPDPWLTSYKIGNLLTKTLEQEDKS